MEYPVIVEQKDEVWRAVIPTLSDLSAEGGSLDEAVRRAQEAAEAYLSSVVLTSIKVGSPPQAVGRRSPRRWIQSAGKFVGDEAAMQQHLEEIYAERRRQREEAEREADASRPDGGAG
jgi:predicted RNase H-like HicB family nuclease